MRALLGILLSVLLLQTQVFALSGGPDYSRGSGNSDIIGTYGGVMVETTDPLDGSNGGSVAVYTVDILQSGTSAGSVLIFNSGRVYPGTMTGVGDNTTSDSTFKAIIEASFNYTLHTLSTNSVTGEVTQVDTSITATTNGTLNTKIESVRNGATSNQIMSGTATLEVANGFVDGNGNFLIDREITYDVSGYRQAATAVGA